MEVGMMEILRLKMEPQAYTVIGVHPSLEDPYTETMGRAIKGVTLKIGTGKHPGKKILNMNFRMGDRSSCVYVCYNTVSDGGGGKAWQDSDILKIPLYIPERSARLDIPASRLISVLSKWCSLMFSPEDNCTPERYDDILVWSVRRKTL